MESEELDLDLQSISLLPLITNTINRLGVLAEQYGITLEQDVPADLPSVQGDGKELERVLSNLLDNALKYTPEGGLITVAVRPVDGQVEVRVTDTGPGIPPEHRERIFDRWTRVPGSEGRRRGLGLGLAFCRSVVEAHGGRIWVVSERYDEERCPGSAFHVVLPLRACPPTTT